MAGFLSLDELFKGRHFDREVVVLCVRWYLRFKLSYRDLVEMMAERGLSLAHTTIMRWVHLGAGVRTPLEPVPPGQPGHPWRVDETYSEDPRQSGYACIGALDSAGQTVDFRLRAPGRDVGAAKAFFRKAHQGQDRLRRPLHWTVTRRRRTAPMREMKTDGQLPAKTKVRSSKYLNNLIEQDHRGVKLRIGPMLGFKWFRSAAIVIAGIELLRRIRKGQFNLRLPPTAQR